MSEEGLKKIVKIIKTKVETDHCITFNVHRKDYTVTLRDYFKKLDSYDERKALISKVIESLENISSGRQDIPANLYQDLPEARIGKFVCD